jgi:hypothetical protein
VVPPFHFHSSHLAEVLGEKKKDKTTEERRRPPGFLTQPRSNGFDALLNTMENGARHGGLCVCGGGRGWVLLKEAIP